MQESSLMTQESYGTQLSSSSLSMNICDMEGWSCQDSLSVNSKSSNDAMRRESKGYFHFEKLSRKASRESSSTNRSSNGTLEAFETLRMSFKPLDSSRQKDRISMSRSGTLGVRRPPTRRHYHGLQQDDDYDENSSQNNFLDSNQQGFIYSPEPNLTLSSVIDDRMRNLSSLPSSYSKNLSSKIKVGFPKEIQLELETKLPPPSELDTDELSGLTESPFWESNYRTHSRSDDCSDEVMLSFQYDASSEASNLVSYDRTSKHEDVKPSVTKKTADPYLEPPLNMNIEPIYSSKGQRKGMNEKSNNRNINALKKLLAPKETSGNSVNGIEEQKKRKKFQREENGQASLSGYGSRKLKQVSLLDRSLHFDARELPIFKSDVYLAKDPESSVEKSKEIELKDERLGSGVIVKEIATIFEKGLNKWREEENSYLNFKDGVVNGAEKSGISSVPISYQPFDSTALLVELEKSVASGSTKKTKDDDKLIDQDSKIVKEGQKLELESSEGGVMNQCNFQDLQRDVELLLEIEGKSPNQNKVSQTWITNDAKLKQTARDKDVTMTITATKDVHKRVPKKVEFSKTEVHFGLESGKLHIVETDDNKPATAHLFRRRRKNNAQFRDLPIPLSKENEIEQCGTYRSKLAVGEVTDEKIFGSNISLQSKNEIKVPFSKQSEYQETLFGSSLTDSTGTDLFKNSPSKMLNYGENGFNNDLKPILDHSIILFPTEKQIKYESSTATDNIENQAKIGLDALKDHGELKIQRYLKQLKSPSSKVESDGGMNLNVSDYLGNSLDNYEITGGMEKEPIETNKILYENGSFVPLATRRSLIEMTNNNNYKNSSMASYQSLSESSGSLNNEYYSMSPEVHQDIPSTLSEELASIMATMAKYPKPTLSTNGSNPIDSDGKKEESDVLKIISDLKSQFSSNQKCKHFGNVDKDVRESSKSAWWKAEPPKTRVSEPSPFEDFSKVKDGGFSLGSIDNCLGHSIEPVKRNDSKIDYEVKSESKISGMNDADVKNWDRILADIAENHSRTTPSIIDSRKKNEDRTQMSEKMSRARHQPDLKKNCGLGNKCSEPQWLSELRVRNSSKSLRQNSLPQRSLVYPWQEENVDSSINISNDRAESSIESQLLSIIPLPMGVNIDGSNEGHESLTKITELEETTSINNIVRSKKQKKVSHGSEGKAVCDSRLNTKKPDEKKYQVPYENLNKSIKNRDYGEKKPIKSDSGKSSMQKKESSLKTKDAVGETKCSSRSDSNTTTSSFRWAGNSSLKAKPQDEKLLLGRNSTVHNHPTKISKLKLNTKGQSSTAVNGRTSNKSKAPVATELIERKDVKAPNRKPAQGKPAARRKKWVT